MLLAVVVGWRSPPAGYKCRITVLHKHGCKAYSENNIRTGQPIPYSFLICPIKNLIRAFFLREGGLLGATVYQAPRRETSNSLSVQYCFPLFFLLTKISKKRVQLLSHFRVTINLIFLFIY